VGLLLTAGFLGLFAAVGLPVSLGARLIADAVPWAGIVLGASLVALGLLSLAGRSPSLPMRARPRARRGGQASSIVLFGAGYGVASLGCTLPIFLALIGASAGAAGALSSVAVFAAYGVGMAVVLVALSVAAALFREGLARGLKRVLPYMDRAGGALLVVAGGYLVYYWSRLHFGPSATLANDPIVGSVTRYTAEVQAAAADRGVPLVAALALAVAAVCAIVLAQTIRKRLQ